MHFDYQQGSHATLKLEKVGKIEIKMQDRETL